MTQPIRVTDITTDDSLAHECIDKINAVLARPWGAFEYRRIVEFEHGTPGEILDDVAQRYTNAGWVVDVLWTRYIGTKPGELLGTKVYFDRLKPKRDYADEITQHLRNIAHYTKGL